MCIFEVPKINIFLQQGQLFKPTDVRWCMYRLLLLILFVTSTFYSLAQIGGRYVYSFLDLNYSARNSALNMPAVPVYDKDIFNGLSNPSLINPKMNNFLGFTATNYLADVAYGSAVFSRTIREKYYGLAGVRYINFGKFTLADEYGNKNGEFHAGDFALNLAAATLLTEKLSTGASINFIYSSYESYRSSGLAIDYGLTYFDTSRSLTVGLLVRNLGFQLFSYTGENAEPLPLDVQIGFSKKPEHNPLRFIIVAHHLNIPDFAYPNPAKKNYDLNGNVIASKVPLSEKIFRHFDVGGELVLSENFHIRFGYSHQARKELQVSTRPALAGYSWGFGLKISKFHISYGNTIYHLAGGSNTFSLTANLSEFTRKKGK